MKKVFHYFLIAASFAPLLTASIAQAQLYAPDPLIKSRNLITSDEIVLMWTHQGGSNNLQRLQTGIYDYNGSQTLDRIRSFQTIIGPYDPDVNTANLSGGAYDNGGTDVVAGDLYFSTPAQQAILTSWRGEDVNGNARALFNIRSFNDFNGCDNPSPPGGQGPTISPSQFLDASLDIPQIKLATGNIISDSAQNSTNGTDEIILAYTASTGKINIHLYEPSSICSNLGGTETSAMPFAIEEDMIEGPTFYNRNDSHVMDVTVDDFDHDGYDEVALAVIHTSRKVWVHVYEYNMSSGQLEEKYARLVVDPYEEFCCAGECCSSGISIDKVNVKIISGEYIGKFAGQEMVVGVVYPAESNSGADGITLIPIRENDTEDGLTIDYCHGCEEACDIVSTHPDSAFCNSSKFLFYQNTDGSSDATTRFDIASGDLDGADGEGLLEEELVMAFGGSIKVFDFSTINATPHDKMQLTLKSTFATDNPQNDQDQDVAGRYAHSFLDVGNIHPISSGSFSNDFTAEIVVASNFIQFDNAVNNNVIAQEFTLRAYTFPLLNGVRDITTPPIEMSKKENVVDISSIRDIRQYSIGLVDIDGGGINIGTAVRRDVQDVVSPVVVINAPPTHFDVFDDDTLDINNLYNAGNLPAPTNDNEKTRTVYSETSATLTEFSAEVSSDWAQSNSISAGFEDFGIKLGASMNETYGERFSSSTGSNRQISFEMTSNIVNSDRVIAYVVNYDFYEYPVYRNNISNDLLTHIMVVTPHYPSNTIEIDAAGFDHDYQLEHQHGNMFSYPYDLTDIQNVGGQFYQLTSQTINNQFNGSSSGVTISEATTGGMTETQSTMNSFEAEGGFSFQGLSIGGSTSGNYSTEDLVTRSTTLSNTKNLTAHFTSIETGLTSLQYTATPILFWDTEGALTIDFTVDLENTTNELWNNYYNTIDPAFLLPDIHTPEKGLEVFSFESLRYKTKDINIYPRPISGNASDVTLFARIHNYGMQTTDVNVGIPVCFYYSQDGDEALQLIGCDTTNSAILGRASDFDNEIVSLQWSIPASLSSGNDPKVVAIIDPDNLHQNEVHDYPTSNGLSNNVAWTCLFTSDCGAIEDASVLFFEFDPCANLESVLELNQHPILPGDYFATDRIILSGQILTGTVNLTAPNGAELTPDFSISSNANLTTSIGDCSNE